MHQHRLGKLKKKTMGIVVPIALSWMQRISAVAVRVAGDTVAIGLGDLGAGSAHNTSGATTGVEAVGLQEHISPPFWSRGSIV
jgi:predicted histidine transporter YuiF (NhaC family)